MTDLTAELHAVAAGHVDVAHELVLLADLRVDAAVLDREVVLLAVGVPQREAAAAGRRGGAGRLAALLADRSDQVADAARAAGDRGALVVDARVAAVGVDRRDDPLGLAGALDDVRALDREAVADVLVAGQEDVAGEARRRLPRHERGERAVADLALEREPRRGRRPGRARGAGCGSSRCAGRGSIVPTIVQSPGSVAIDTMIRSGRRIPSSAPAARAGRGDRGLRAHLRRARAGRRAGRRRLVPLRHPDHPDRARVRARRRRRRGARRASRCSRSGTPRPTTRSPSSPTSRARCRSSSSAGSRGGWPIGCASPRSRPPPPPATSSSRATSSAPRTSTATSWSSTARGRRRWAGRARS